MKHVTWKNVSPEKRPRDRHHDHVTPHTTRGGGRGPPVCVMVADRPPGRHVLMPCSVYVHALDDDLNGDDNDELIHLYRTHSLTIPKRDDDESVYLPRSQSLTIPRRGAGRREDPADHPLSVTSAESGVFSLTCAEVEQTFPRSLKKEQSTAFRTSTVPCVSAQEGCDSGGSGSVSATDEEDVRESETVLGACAGIDRGRGQCLSLDRVENPRQMKLDSSHSQHVSSRYSLTNTVCDELEVVPAAEEEKSPEQDSLSRSATTDKRKAFSKLVSFIEKRVQRSPKEQHAVKTAKTSSSKGFSVLRDGTKKSLEIQLTTDLDGDAPCKDDTHNAIHSEDAGESALSDNNQLSNTTSQDSADNHCIEHEHCRAVDDAQRWARKFGGEVGAVTDADREKRQRSFQGLGVASPSGPSPLQDHGLCHDASADDSSKGRVGVVGHDDTGTEMENEKEEEERKDLGESSLLQVSQDQAGRKQYAITPEINSGSFQEAEDRLHLEKRSHTDGTGIEPEADNTHLLELQEHHLPNTPQVQSGHSALQSVPQRSGATRSTSLTCTPHHTPGDPTVYVCQVCGTWYERNELLLVHQEEHPIRRQYPSLRCGGCGAEFGFSGGLSRHMALNTGLRGFRCPRCRQPFRRCEDVFRHRQDDRYRREGKASIIAPNGFLRKRRPRLLLGRY